MKKKITLLILVVTLLFSVTAVAFGADVSTREQAVQKLIQGQRAKLSDEIGRLSKVLQQQKGVAPADGKIGSEKSQTFDSFDTAGAYKINVLQSLTISAYENNKIFKDAFTDTYQWRVPVKNANGNLTAVVVSKDNKLTYTGLINATNALFTDNELASAIAESNVDISAIQSIEYGFSDVYNTIFVLIDTKDKNYCVLYSADEKSIGVESGKVFLLSDVMEKLNSRFDETVLKVHPGAQGLPFRRSNTAAFLLIVGAVLVVALLAVALIVLRNKIKEQYVIQKDDKVFRFNRPPRR